MRGTFRNVATIVGTATRGTNLLPLVLAVRFALYIIKYVFLVSVCTLYYTAWLIIFCILYSYLGIMLPSLARALLLLFDPVLYFIVLLFSSARVLYHVFHFTVYSLEPVAPV